MPQSRRTCRQDGGARGRRAVRDARPRAHGAGVSQFWTYKPEEYLKRPLYTRDYPPCRHCA